MFDSHVYAVGDRVLVLFANDFDKVVEVHPAGSQYHYRLEEAGDVMSREIAPAGGAKTRITKEEFPISPFAADKLRISSKGEKNFCVNALVHRGKTKPPLSYVIDCDTLIAAVGVLTFIRDKHATCKVRHEIIETTRVVHSVVDLTRQEGGAA